MIDYDRQLKTARIAPGDPELAAKSAVFRALEFELPENGPVDLYDCSSRSNLTAEEIKKLDEMQNSGTLILRDPLLTMRHWAFAESVRKFGCDNSAGLLSSFRIFLNLPRQRAWSQEEFKTQILPQLCDLAEFLSDRPALQLQLNHVEGINHAFGLITLQDNIVAEFECHDQLPDTLEPMRFIHAYYQNGAISNLPLAGFLNMEGILVATEQKLERQVIENNDFDSFDEVDNWYFRTIWSLRNHRPEAPVYTTQQQWQEVVAQAWNTFNPIEVTR